MKALLFPLFMIALLTGCSKSGGSGSGSGSGNNSGTGSANSSGLVPLKQGNVWNYRLKNYNTSTGTLTDSSSFTLTVNGQSTANGATYYKVVNSLDNSVLWLSNLNSTTLGSIDSINGVNYYTAFVSGTGDSTASVSSWPVVVNSGCTGTEKLYGYYADTTLTNLDGTVYSNSIKNVAVIFNCSGEKAEAQVYFMQQGVGLVRYSQYIYSNTGALELQLAWVLESSSLQ
jgi:hypothetical protein